MEHTRHQVFERIEQLLKDTFSSNENRIGCTTDPETSNTIFHIYRRHEHRRVIVTDDVLDLSLEHAEPILTALAFTLRQLPDGGTLVAQAKGVSMLPA